VSISGQPPSFDPAAADLGEAAYIWTGLYDTLLKVDVDGAIQPNAAEKWEYSEDGLTLTLTLREDLTFSDDSAITAEDVAATIERSRASSGLRTPDLALVTSVEATDERTVVLTLSEGDPDERVVVGAARRAGPRGRTTSRSVREGRWMLTPANLFALVGGVGLDRRRVRRPGVVAVVQRGQGVPQPFLRGGIFECGHERHDLAEAGTAELRGHRRGRDARQVGLEYRSAGGAVEGVAEGGGAVEHIQSLPGAVGGSVDEVAASVR